MPDIPTGLVTFLFTDIEGSTRLWEQQHDGMSRTLPHHDACLRRAIESAGGYVFKTVGDAFCAAFASPDAAFQAALHAQLALHTDPLLNGQAGGPLLRVRMGLHVGEPICRDNDYFGGPVNRAARIESAAHGGQILLSNAARNLIAASLPALVSLREMGAHRLKDLAEPEPLFQALHPNLPADFPPIRSLAIHPNNLPVQLTAFVGRERDIASLHALFSAGARLVTITGPGGIGKTRIAIQVAADRIERFPGGVWWADLSAVTDPQNVLPALAGLFDLHSSPDRSLVEQIAAHLKEARALIVLDNCEQVVDAAPQIDALLRACPQLVILATSRAALNLSSEHVFPISELSSEEAVELFVQRARQFRPAFPLNDTTLPVIQRICSRLENIPLALELAAAQSRMLALPHIEKQLSQRFKLLVSPYRDVQQRQRTLRAAVDWSYDLLALEDRALFQQMSVFVGGFSLEDAEAVCECEDTFGGLSRLCEQSLLRTEENEIAPRFRMLETLRDYGLEKLEAGGQAEVVSERWARHFSTLAQNYAGEDTKTISREEQASLVINRENLRASLNWLLNRSDFEEASSMAVALTDFWERQGTFQEGQEYLRRCLAGVQEPGHQARLLVSSGWLAYRMTAYDEAVEILERSLELCRLAKDRNEEANALNTLALCRQAQERFDLARSLFKQSLQIVERAGEEAKQAARLSNLGLLAIAEGRLEEAKQNLTDALNIYEANQDAHRTAVCLVNLSDLALKTQDWNRARILAYRCHSLFQETGDHLGMMFALVNLAQAAAHCNSSVEVGRCLRRALPMFKTTDMRAVLPALLIAWAYSLANEDKQRGAAAFAAAERSDLLLGTGELAAHSFEVEWTINQLQLSDTGELSRAREAMTSLTLEEIVSTIQNSLQEDEELP